MFQIYFHGRDYKSLLDHIDGKYLPKKYGGTMGLLHFNRMEFYELLCMYQDGFEGEPDEVLSQCFRVWNRGLYFQTRMSKL
jgi:hypothetical protein